MRIGEVGLMTNDVIRLANFYRRILHLQGSDENPMHQFVIAEETTLTIANDNLTPEQRGQNQSICLAFTVDDVDQEYAHLKSMGVEIVEEPTNRPWGARNMHFLDPDGNHVYFRSLLK